METLKTKEQVKTELNKSGISICLSRSVGYNSFNLVYESYGQFVVNAVAGTSFDSIKEFTKHWGNINICIDN